MQVSRALESTEAGCPVPPKPVTPASATLANILYTLSRWSPANGNAAIYAGRAGRFDMRPAVGTILPDVGRDRLGVERAPLFGRISLAGCPPWCGQSPRCNCRARTPTQASVADKHEQPVSDRSRPVPPSDRQGGVCCHCSRPMAAVRRANFLLLDNLVHACWQPLRQRAIGDFGCQLWLVIAVMSGSGFAMLLLAKSPARMPDRASWFGVYAGVLAIAFAAAVFGHRRKPALSPGPPRSWR